MSTIMKKVAQYGLAALTGHEVSQALTPQKEVMVEKTIVKACNDSTITNGNNNLMIIVILIVVIVIIAIATCIFKMVMNKPQAPQQAPQL